MRARRRTGEGGFTLVEVMVATLLLAIALTGLAQLAGSQMVASLRTKVRQVGIAYVNQELESLRSMTYTRLAMDPSDNTVPNSKTVGTTTWAEVQGTSGCAGTSCLTYSKSVNLTNNQVTGTACATATTGSCFSFTETRWIGQISGAAYKTAFITLTSTSGPSFTYNSQTDVSGATTNNPTAVTAIQVNLQQVDTSGNVVTDPTTGNAEVPPDGFTVTVMQGTTTITSGTTADGAFNVNSGLSASSSYTCTISNPGGASFSTWIAYSANDTSFSCNTGAAGTTSVYTSNWKQAGCTATGGTGGLTVTVYNNTGALAPNVKVTLAAAQSQGNPAPTNLTTPNTTPTTGQVTWATSAIPAGLVTVSLSGGGFKAMNNLDSTCVWSGQTSQLYVFGAPTGPGTFNLTVPVKNTYPAGTAMLALQAVDGSGNKFEVQNDLDGCGTSCAGVNMVVPVYKNTSYTMTVNCVGVGGVTSAPPDGEGLYTFTTANITANTTYSAASVKCPTS